MATLKNLTTVFQSQDKTQTLTIVAARGKSAYNVKASVKTGKGKGSAKAVTGCRASFAESTDAEELFQKLVEDAKSTGWVKVDKRVRNAFTEIPKPGEELKAAPVEIENDVNVAVEEDDEESDVPSALVPPSTRRSRRSTQNANA